MNMTQRFFSRVSALAAFALALTAFGPQAQALKTRIDTPIGEISFAFDTVASVGISLRTKSRDFQYVSSQSGGNTAVQRSAAAAALSPMGFTLAGTNPNAPTYFPVNATAAVIGRGIAPTGGAATAGFVNVATSVGVNGVEVTGEISYVGGGQINLAASANGDDGRLNFDKGDITALTLKVLSDIQADLSTNYGEFTAFARVVAYADPVLRDGSFYERIGPDDAAKRELGRDLKILDGYLSWDWDIPTGISEIGKLPFNLRVGKLTTNNWGEATFSLSGISAGIVIDVPSARRAGAEIKEIIQPEFMVYGSIGLPFDVSLDAYYQFHHTIWNLDVGGSPTATSDLGNPGNEIGGYLWLSSSPTSGTFRDNCAGLGSAFRQVATSYDTPLPRRLNADGSNCTTDNITHFATPYSDFSGTAAEQLRLDNGDLNAGTQVQFTDADDQGQWGVRLSYYVDTFYIIPPMGAMMGGMMEDGFSLPGIEFNFSYQNVHSRVPYVRYSHGGAPIITKSIVGSSSTASIALQTAGCAGGAADPNSPLLPFLNALVEAADLGGGYLLSGQFRDATIQSTQQTSGRSDIRDGLLELDLDRRHFRNGIDDLMPYAQTADAILRDHFDGLALLGIAAGIPGVDAAGLGAILFRAGVMDPTLTLQEQGIAAVAGPIFATQSQALHADNSIENSLRDNGANRYDTARIVCAQVLAQTDVLSVVVDTPANPLGVFPIVGSEYIAVQYNPKVELYYPENIQIIGGSFNTTIPWLEWGIQGEISWRPDMPIQVDVTEQIITVPTAQGTGFAALGDVSRFTLSPAVTRGVDQTLSGARADDYYDDYDQVIAGYPARVQMDLATAQTDLATAQTDLATATTAETDARTALAAAPTDMALQTALGTATATLGTATAALGTATGAVATQEARLAAAPATVGAATLAARGLYPRGFIASEYQNYVDGTSRLISEFESDMLNFTIGTTALYNNSNPVVNFLGADQAIVLMEFNVVQFLDTFPGGWGGGVGPTFRADKGITLHCIARAGTELPLGALVGFDTIQDRRCTPDETSMGYTIFGFLDYNNVFGTAWRLRPSMAVRHGVNGNTPSPVPGWREDALSVTWGLEANFQNSWRASMSYVAFFDVGSNDYNSNSGFDTWSFNISYAF